MLSCVCGIQISFPPPSLHVCVCACMNICLCVMKIERDYKKGGRRFLRRERNAKQDQWIYVSRNQKQNLYRIAGEGVGCCKQEQSMITLFAKLCYHSKTYFLVGRPKSNFKLKKNIKEMVLRMLIPPFQHLSFCKFLTLKTSGRVSVGEQVK